MDIKRLVAALLVVAAVAVVAQAVIPGGRHDLWQYLNPVMAVSIVAVVALSAWQLRRGAGGPAGGGVSEVGLVFFLGLFLAYLFFFNWFRELDVGEGHGWVWIVLNGAIPVLNVWAAVRLWTDEGE